METTEIIVTVTIHRRERAKCGQDRRRTSLRRWIARMNGWTVVWYALLTVAGILLYKAGAAYAMRERGYFAIGGEALALLLPVLWYLFAKVIRGYTRDQVGYIDEW